MKQFIKRIVTLGLSLLLPAGLFAGCGGTKDGRIEGPGFKTAEEAVGAYAETLRKLDLTEMAAGTMNDSIADENILLKNHHMSLNDYPVLGKTGFGEPLSRVCEANRTAQAMLVSYLKVAARIKGAEGNYQEALPGWTKLASGVDTRDSETRAALREYLSDPKIAEAFAGMEIVGMEEITDEETVKSAELMAPVARGPGSVPPQGKQDENGLGFFEKNAFFPKLKSPKFEATSQISGLRGPNCFT